MTQNRPGPASSINSLISVLGYKANMLDVIAAFIQVTFTVTMVQQENTIDIHCYSRRVKNEVH